MEMAPLLRSTSHLKPSVSVQASSLHSRPSTPATRFNGNPAAKTGWFQQLITKLKDWLNRFISFFKKEKPSNSSKASISAPPVAMHPRAADRWEKLAKYKYELTVLPEQFETWLKGLEAHYKCLSPEGAKRYPNWSENLERTNFTGSNIEKTLSTLIQDCHNLAGSLQVVHPDAAAQIKKCKTLASETKKIRDQIYKFNDTCPQSEWTEAKQALYSEHTQALKEAFKDFLAKAESAFPQPNP